MKLKKYDMIYNTYYRFHNLFNNIVLLTFYDNNLY